MAVLDIKNNNNKLLCDPVWPSGEAGKQKGLGLILLWLSCLFKKVVVCGHCLVTLSITITNMTINETL